MFGKKHREHQGSSRGLEARLEKAFSGLSADGAISYNSRSIDSAGLNIVDRPELRKYIPDVTKHLYAQVKASGVQYDAVTSCPRGGNAWAEALVGHAKNDGHEVSFYRLNKVDTRYFSIIDGQAVPAGARLLVADDTIYLGRTSAAAVEVLEGAGYKVVGLVFPVEIGMEGRRNWDRRGYPIFSTYNNDYVQALR